MVETGRAECTVDMDSFFHLRLSLQCRSRDLTPVLALALTPMHELEKVTFHFQTPFLHLLDGYVLG